MKKILFLLFIVICLILLSFFYGEEIYTNLRKTLFNSQDKDISISQDSKKDSVFSNLVEGSEEEEEDVDFPGEGEIMGMTPFDQIFFVSKTQTTNRGFDVPENRSKYSLDEYDIIDVPAQKYLDYAVGTFNGLEDIEGSSDKYVLVKCSSSEEAKRFRINFEKSDLFGKYRTSFWTNDPTVLLDEDIKASDYRSDDPAYASYGEITYDGLLKNIKEGDTIVLLPISSPPELSKKDNLGNYIVSNLLIKKIQ